MAVSLISSPALFVCLYLYLSMCIGLWIEFESVDAFGFFECLCVTIELRSLIVVK